MVAEESISIGCAGREISGLLRRQGLLVPSGFCNIGNQFVQHGDMKSLYRLVGIDAESMAQKAREVLKL